MTLILLPQPKSAWRTPSLSRPKDFAGNEDQTRFSLTARLSDGHIVWRGWFDDRDDADAFLWAIASGTLRQQPDLWRMPAPWWDPYLDADLTYEFATVTFIVTTGAGTYNTPSDWDQFNNSVQVIAGGVTGTTGGAAFAYPGGAGGGYSASSNLTISGSVSLAVGGLGGSTWFNGASAGAATVSATTATNTGNGATKYNGGSGGGGDAGTGSSGGGGGAAGPHGNGNNGTNTGTLGGTGGSGDAGFGGGGGDNSAGGNGTEFDATHGCGGGGCGGRSGGGGRAGGYYGAGGGGAGKSTPSPGSGIQGLIVVTYTPVSIFSFNLAAIGM